MALPISMMKRLIKIAVFTILIASLLFIWFGWQVVTYNPTGNSALFDCAIVLGAGVTDEKPSPVFEARLKHARDLYQAGKVKKIITTGGVGSGDILSEGEAGAIYLASQGVPTKDLMSENTSSTTIGNLRGAKAIMETGNLQSAVLVSDPYHLRRAEMIAKAYGVDAYTSPTPFTRYRSLKSKAQFLFYEVIFSVELWFWLLRR